MRGEEAVLANADQRHHEDSAVVDDPDPKPTIDSQGFRAWLDKHKVVTSVVGGLIALMFTILGVALSPLGDKLQERIFPTSAIVEGTILIGQVPVALMDVVLDERRTTRTRSMGEFFFDGVGSGIHSLQIVEDERVVYQREFAVDRGAERVPVQTDLAVAVPIPATPSSVEPPGPTQETQVAASPMASPMASPASTVTPSVVGDEEPFLAVELGSAPSGDLIATMRIVAHPTELDQITQVTYTLPEGFNPSVVTRYSAADQFALVFVPAEGETTVAATVVFEDGHVIDLTETVRP